MDADKSSVDAQLARLKTLARDLLASDTPELDLLDEMAALAGDVARDWRARARQQMLDQVTVAAREVFPETSDLLPRLIDLPLEDLSSLWALLDNAVDARTALGRADDGLRSAHERGDYAAMAPLAVEADTQKQALARSTAAFTDRMALGAALLTEMPTAIATDAVSEPPDISNVVPLPTEIVSRPTEVVLAAAEPAAEEAAPAEHAVDEPEALPAATEDRENEAGGEQDAAAQEEPREGSVLFPRGERRRVRDLIRQMRSVPDEAS